MKTAKITISFNVHDDGSMESVKLDKDVPDDFPDDGKEGVHGLFKWIGSQMAEALS